MPGPRRRLSPPVLALLASLALSVAACDREEPPAPEIALEGVGGEVWAWSRLVTGTADPACVFVTVRGPLGEIVAERLGSHVSAVVPLDEGDNQVRAVCREASGRETLSAPVAFRVRLEHHPTALVRVSIGDGVVVLDAGGSTPDEEGTPLASFSWSERQGNPEPLAGPGGEPLDWPVEAERLTLAAPETDGEYYVSLEVTDELGARDESTVLFRVLYGEPLPVDLSTESADWIEGAVVYSVLPHLFGEEGLRSVIARLDDLADLGVTALLLSPVFPTADGDYGYSIVDLFGVREDLGTDGDLRDLIEQAHDRGLRVLLDLVPNHTSSEHPYFREAEEHGPESAQYDYYDRDEDGEPTHYFDWADLPNLNYDNPEVRRLVIEASTYWVRSFDVDGFRVDAAWGVAERNPEFFPEWRRELLRLKPDLLLAAEASARFPYYFRHGFDVAYDWTYEPGEWAWEEAFEADDGVVEALDAALTNEGEGYPDDALVLRFLNNNDTGQRFVTRHGQELLVPATVLLLTLPGVPYLFTGDEVGAEFEPYQQLEPISFEDERGLRELHQRLIALRRDQPALRSRSWLQLAAAPAQIYAYLRLTPEGDRPLLVVLNFSDTEAPAQLVLPPDYQDTFAGTVLHDLLADEEVPFSVAGEIEVPAWSGLVLALPE